MVILGKSCRQRLRYLGNGYKMFSTQAGLQEEVNQCLLRKGRLPPIRLTTSLVDPIPRHLKALPLHPQSLTTLGLLLQPPPAPRPRIHQRTRFLPPIPCTLGEPYWGRTLRRSFSLYLHIFNLLVLTRHLPPPAHAIALVTWHLMSLNVIRMRSDVVIARV